MKTKGITRLLILSLMLSMLLGVNISAKSKKVKIKVTGKKTVGIGETIKLSVNSKGAKFKAGDSLTTVDGIGNVTGVKFGDSKVIVQLKDGSKIEQEIRVRMPGKVKLGDKEIALNNRKETVIKRFGEPDRIGDSLYGGDVYVYNKDLSKYMLVYMKEDSVIGYYVLTCQGFQYANATEDTKLTDDVVENMDLMDLYLNGKFRKSPDSLALLLFDYAGDSSLYGLEVIRRDIQNEEEDMTESVLAEMSLQMYEMVNVFRLKNGLKELKYAEDLSKVALDHSRDMADRNYFSHITPEGLTPNGRVSRAGLGYKYNAGENISAGYPSSVWSIFGLMQSPGHRRNMLDTDYTHLGTGVAHNSKSKHANYYVQKLARIK